MALLNRNIKRLVQNLSEATKSKKYLAEFVQVVASDETFATGDSPYDKSNCPTGEENLCADGSPRRGHYMGICPEEQRQCECVRGMTRGGKLGRGLRRIGVWNCENPRNPKHGKPCRSSGPEPEEKPFKGL